MADGNADPFAPLEEDELQASTAAPPLPSESPCAPAPHPLPDVIHHPRHGAPAAVWRYVDAAGALLFVVCRFDLADGRKEVVPYSCSAAGWRWKAAPAPRPLYGLDRLAVRPDAPVLLCEGEKTADAAAELFGDHVAVTWPGGAKAMSKADWTPLAGRTVVLWPDADEPGRAAAQAIAKALRATGAASVAVVDVPADWPEGWDVADPLPDGVTAETLAGMLAAAAEGISSTDTLGDTAPADEVARLAALPPLDFARERRAAASRLGMTVRDLERAIQAHRRRVFQEREAAERERQCATPGAVIWPPGFRMEAQGLIYLGDSDDALPVKICDPFQILGESRTGAGQSWGLWLAWQDRDGRRHQLAMQRRLLMAEPGALEAELADRGLRIGATAEARALLRIALAEVETAARVTAVNRTGWHVPAGGAPGYVLADGATIGATAEPLVLLNPAEEAARRVATAGTLEAWREKVAALARSNPVAVFCLSAAFVGPLLELAGEDGGGVHLFGPSKRGKTVTLKLAASVWGPPDKAGALRDWRTTGNALEAACEEAADGLLTLDEIQQAEPRDVVGAVYAMGNGGGKGRLRADATARRRRTWRTFFLSNGEVDVPTIAQKAGQRVPPGAEVRLPSIPLPDRLWPELHGRPGFQELCAELAGVVTRQHGTAARAFIERIATIREEDPETLASAIGQMRDAFLKKHVPDGADPQVREVARRLALVAAAGEIATELGVLPWAEDEATEAAAAMFASWRDRRGGDGSGEDAAHLAKVRLFIVQHGSGRMQPIRMNASTGQMEEVTDPSRPIINRAGWRRRTADGTDLYLFASDTWRSEVCEGLDPTAAARTLLAAGHLEAGDGKNLPRRESIPGLGRLRVYAVKSSLLAGEDLGDEDGGRV